MSRRGAPVASVMMKVDKMKLSVWLAQAPVPFPESGRFWAGTVVVAFAGKQMQHSWAFGQ